MNYQKMKEMVYRAIYIDAWVSHVGIQTQATRNLKIQTAKLSRLSWWDKIEFLDRIESPKKLMRVTVKNDSEINSTYKLVMSLVKKVFQDIAAHKKEEHLTIAQIQKRADEFIREVEAYGRRHSPE